MKFHSFLTVLFICISVIYIFYPFIIEQYDNKTLTFTNTQTWDSTLLQTIDRLTEKDKAFIQSLTIDTSPLDNTHHEIRDLINKKKKRTKERIKDIKKENNDDPTLQFLFSRFNIQDKKTQDTMIKVVHKINPIILYLKKHFNRVRPSFMDKNIKPVIDTPNHPSYPSGHATTAYLIAYLLPKKNFTKNYKIADKIAVNREIAGVHYKSDTAYGKYLSKKLYKYIKQLSKNDTL
jgi:hypothetical protein